MEDDRGRNVGAIGGTGGASRLWSADGRPRQGDAHRHQQGDAHQGHDQAQEAADDAYWHQRDRERERDTIFGMSLEVCELHRERKDLYAEISRLTRQKQRFLEALRNRGNPQQDASADRGNNAPAAPSPNDSQADVLETSLQLNRDLISRLFKRDAEIWRLMRGDRVDPAQGDRDGEFLTHQHRLLRERDFVDEISRRYFESSKFEGVQSADALGAEAAELLMLLKKGSACSARALGARDADVADLDRRLRDAERSVSNQRMVWAALARMRAYGPTRGAAARGGGRGGSLGREAGGSTVAGAPAS